MASVNLPCSAQASAVNAPVDIAAAIDSAGFNPLTLAVMALSCSAMFVEGFDSAAISYVAP